MSRDRPFAFSLLIQCSTNWLALWPASYTTLIDNFVLQAVAEIILSDVEQLVQVIIGMTPEVFVLLSFLFRNP